MIRSESSKRQGMIYPAISKPGCLFWGLLFIFVIFPLLSNQNY